MNQIINIDNCKSYATEENLDKALKKSGLDNCNWGYDFTCRYMKCRNSSGRWTAIFLVNEFFRINKTGGYVGFAADKGFMSI